MTNTPSVLVAKLNNGVYIPAIGFGTWQLSDTVQTTETAVEALKMGYHHIDTAHVYNNQPCLGEALKQFSKAKGRENRTLAPGPHPCFHAVSETEFFENFSHPHGKPTDDRTTFVTGKTPEKVRASIDQHLKEMGRESTDLILMHWPAPMTMWSSNAEMVSPNNAETRLIVWKTLESLVAEKKIRAIGVANFVKKHLQPLVEDALRRKAEGDKNAVIPQILQTEISPLLHADKDLVDFCREHKIHITSYSTLGSTESGLRSNAKIEEIAKEANRTPTQVILRWALQSGYLVIPRTSNAAHAGENLGCLEFSLTEEKFNKMNELHNGSRVCPDPHEAT